MSSKSAAGILDIRRSRAKFDQALTANHGLPSMDSAWVRPPRLLEPFQGSFGTLVESRSTQICEPKQTLLR